MNPIEELKAEHRGIENALAVLERIAARIDASDNSQTIRDAEALMDFFKTFADTCHHGKEEGVLFPLLERMGISREGGPIGVMLAEHNQGRKHIDGMVRALKSLREPMSSGAERFRQDAAGYIHLLRAHIDKEEHILFRIAEQCLANGQQEELATEFERIEHDIVGAGKHEQFHAMLDAFRKQYGG